MSRKNTTSPAPRKPRAQKRRQTKPTPKRAQAALSAWRRAISIKILEPLSVLQDAVHELHACARYGTLSPEELSQMADDVLDLEYDVLGNCDATAALVEALGIRTRERG